MGTIKTRNETDPKTGLPPAGDAMREELKRRTDQLQEKAESGTMPEAYSMPTNSLEPDRELQYAMQNFSMHEVTNKQPGFHYGWVFTGHHGTDITMKKALGWQVVQGDDPESPELQNVDTTRRLGDCILMRIPEPRYQKILAYEEYVRRMKMGAGDEELQELGKKMGLEVTKDDPTIIKRFGGNTPASMVLTAAGGPVEKMLRQGTVPGLTPGQ